MTVRIYGKWLNKWHAWNEAKDYEELTQVEYEYTDYDSATGEIVATGTEDIQYGQGRNWMHRRAWCTVYTWDGVKRSKGYTNNRTFDYRDTLYYRPDRGAQAAIRNLMKHRFPEAVEISVRSR